jgi:hypothetical protein
MKKGEDFDGKIARIVTIFDEKFNSIQPKGVMQRSQKGVALVDGEHKLRQWMKKYLPWFLIIKEVIIEFKGLLEIAVGERKEQLRKVITYLENGKNYIVQEKQRLYGNFIESEAMELAA